MTDFRGSPVSPNRNGHVNGGSFHNGRSPSAPAGRVQSLLYSGSLNSLGVLAVVVASFAIGLLVLNAAHALGVPLVGRVPSHPVSDGIAVLIGFWVLQTLRRTGRGRRMEQTLNASVFRLLEAAARTGPARRWRAIRNASHHRLPLYRSR